jgi:CheY-like chemotaxis protein
MRILWVDDQLDVAKTLANSLKGFDCEIDFCSSGEDALEQLKKASYNIILSDLAMPPGTWGGLWLLEQLSKSQRSLPVIVVSGEGSQVETIQALRLGAYDYVTKENISEELPKQLLAFIEATSIKEKDLQSIINIGETSHVEFKSTLRFNILSKRNDSNIELAILKTVAGFLNSSGGRLLVGVDDKGALLGLDLDQFKNLDGFQLHFWNLVRNAIGPEFSEFIEADVVKLNDTFVFSVICHPSKRAVFVKWKESGDSKYQELFYVRAGPQTELLSSSQTLGYVRDHFVS